MTEPHEASLFMRKPQIHPGYKVSAENIDAVAAWCQGTVIEPGTTRAYIRIPTNNPVQQRSRYEAQLGQWIVKTGRSFSVYTQRYIDSEFVVIPGEDTELGSAVQMTTRVAGIERAVIPEQAEPPKTGESDHCCCQHQHGPIPNAPTPKKFNGERHTNRRGPTR